MTEARPRKGTERVGSVTLRRALPADLALLRRWDEQPHVGADPDDAWAWEQELHEDPDWRAQLIVEVDGRPVGFVQVIDPAREPTRYWGDVPAGLRALDVWIGEAEDLGQGYGTRALELVLERCFADPYVTAALVDPLATNVRAHRFYERLGFRFVEARRLGRAECSVYRIERDAFRARRAEKGAP